MIKNGKDSVKVGNMYGTWKVIQVDCINPASKAKRKRKGAFCECQCGCGKIQFMEYRQLYDGRTLGCSKTTYKKAAETRMNKTKIPNGTKFGYLTVIDDLGMNDYKQPKHMYLCKCNCGATIPVAATHLKSGHTKSCGCMKQSNGEQIIENLLCDNNIHFVKEYTFTNLISPKGGYYRFDFAIFQNDKLIKLIEFDGVQHYKEGTGIFAVTTLKQRQEADQIKSEYCKNNNILLQRIPYWDIDKIDLQYLNLQNYHYEVN